MPFKVNGEYPKDAPLSHGAAGRAEGAAAAARKICNTGSSAGI